jgi:hypothetical protein
MAQAIAASAGDPLTAARLGIPTEDEAIVARYNQLNREWYGDLPKKDWIDRTANKLGEMSYEVAQGSIEAAAYLTMVQAVTGTPYGQAAGAEATTLSFAKATAAQSAKFGLFSAVTTPGDVKERLTAGYLATLYNMTPIASR